MDELLKLRQAAKHRQRTIARANADFAEAVLAAYRAKRDDGMPENSLAEIGEVLGVSRQRAFQIVREASSQATE